MSNRDAARRAVNLNSLTASGGTSAKGAPPA